LCREKKIGGGSFPPAPDGEFKARRQLTLVGEELGSEEKGLGGDPIGGVIRGQRKKKKKVEENLSTKLEKKIIRAAGRRV